MIFYNYFFGGIFSNEPLFLSRKSGQKALAGHKILINSRPRLAKFAMHPAEAGPGGIARKFYARLA